MKESDVNIVGSNEKNYQQLTSRTSTLTRVVMLATFFIAGMHRIGSVPKLVLGLFRNCISKFRITDLTVRFFMFDVHVTQETIVE